jgi:hypothetical protein
MFDKGKKYKEIDTMKKYRQEHNFNFGPFGETRLVHNLNDLYHKENNEIISKEITKNIYPAHL